MKLFFILIIAIPLQFYAPFLALRLVRVTKKTAWAFLCTGYSEAITPEKAKAAGIRELLIKPFIPRQLAEIIRRVLDKEKHHVI